MARLRLGALAAGWVALGAVAGCDVSRPEWQGAPSTCADPGLPSEVYLDDRCTARRCVATARVRGCALDIDVTGCERAPLRIELSLDGAPAAASRGEATCEVLEGGPGWAAFECDRCRVDVHRPVAPEPLDVVGVLVRDVAPWISGQHTSQPLDYFQSLTGYLSDMETTADRVFVGHHPGDPAYRGECDDPGPSTVDVFDPVSLARISSATAAPCLGRLARQGGAVYALFGGAELSVARFDEAGRTVARAVLVPPTQAVLHPVALLADEARLFGLFTTRRDPRVSAAVRIDPADLSVGGWRLEPDTLFRGGALDGDWVVAVDRITGLVYGLDPERDLGEARGTLFDVYRRSDDGGSVLALPAGPVLIAATGQSGAVYRYPPGDRGFTQGQAALSFELEATPWALSPWSAAPGQVVVGLTGVGAEAPARLARFDVEAARFVPGSVELGVGLVSRIREGPDGALFALLPWQARLLRIR